MMPLPPKEYYSIAEVADRYAVPASDIEHYIYIGRIQASIDLPRTMLFKYTLQPEEVNLESDNYIYEIDLYDPEHLQPQQGLFNLLYSDINWSDEGIADLKTRQIYLKRLEQDDEAYGFYEPYCLNKKDVVITLSELNRFETEHMLSDEVAGKQNNNEKLAGSSTPVNLLLGTKERESLLKLVIFLAAEYAGYDPSLSKSPIPTEISTYMQDRGMDMDVGTIRKYLKEGAPFLGKRPDSD
jgi:hypothetical protein